MCCYANIVYICVSIVDNLVSQLCVHNVGNKPPGLVPNKFLYMTKDMERLAQYFEVPLKAPSNPFEAMFEKGKAIHHWALQLFTMATSLKCHRTTFYLGVRHSHHYRIPYSLLFKC